MLSVFLMFLISFASSSESMKHSHLDLTGPADVYIGDSVNFTCSIDEETRQMYPDVHIKIFRLDGRPFDNIIDMENYTIATIDGFNNTGLHTIECLLLNVPQHVYNIRTTNILVIGRLLSLDAVNLHCNLYDLQTLTCSFQPIKTGILTTWQLIIHTQYHSYDKGCTYELLAPSDDVISCSRKGVYTFNTNLRVTLKVNNTHQSFSSNLTLNSYVDNVFSPVVDLEVSEIKSRSLRLKWKLKAFVKHLYLKSKVTLTSKWGSESRIFTHGKNVDTHAIEGFQKTVVLKDLIPLTRYTLGVQIKLFSARVWSAPSTVEATTDNAAPIGQPMMEKNSFTQFDINLRNNSRKVALYWMNLPPNDSYGNISYLVRTSRPNKDYVTHITSIILTLSTDFAHHIWVRVKNEMGESEAVTSFNLPRLNNIEKVAVKVKAVLLNDTTAMVSWTSTPPHRQFKSVHAHYCQGVILHRYDSDIAQCSSGFNSVVTDESQSKLNVYPAHSPSLYNYGVSFVTAKGKLTGIYWAPCLLNFMDGAKDPDNIHVVQERDNVIRISWFSCVARYGLSKRLELIYYRDVTKSCGDAGGKRANVLRSPYVIKNVDKGSRYKICLRNIVRNRTSNWSSVIGRTNTGRLNAGAIVGLVATSLIILVIVFIIIKCVRRKPLKFTVSPPPKIVGSEMYEGYFSQEPRDYDQPQIIGSDYSYNNLGDHMTNANCNKSKINSCDGSRTDEKALLCLAVESDDKVSIESSQSADKALATFSHKYSRLGGHDDISDDDGCAQLLQLTEINSPVPVGYVPVNCAASAPTAH